MSEERDDLLVLMDDEGNETEFEYLDTVELSGKEYVVLLPVQEGEEEPDEVLILKVEKDENGEDVFASVDDKEELAEAFEKFKEQAQDEFDFEEE